MVYKALAKVASVAARWGRTEVQGLEHLPENGGVLVVANHDSQMDPIVLAALFFPHRPLRFLARADLWDKRWVAPFMTRMGHVPVERGAGDWRAIQAVTGRLRGGEAILVFPEGGLSRGKRVRARRGVARIARACPDAEILLLAITGTTDFVRFPRRPRVTVRLFPPANGHLDGGDDLAAVATGLMDEIRAVAPPAAAGRSGPVARRLRERRLARLAARRPVRVETPPGHAVHR